MHKNIYDTVIIGAGASGLMAASIVKDQNIAVIDANGEIGAKIKISGGGKCNITNKNISAENYLCDRKFVKSIFKKFDQKDLLRFLQKRGVNPVLKKDDQYFCKNSSEEIINIFKKEIKKSSLFLNHKVLSVSKDEFFIIKTDQKEFFAKNIIVASGGLSYPKIGASDIGYKIAESFGHKVNKTAPALVGFTVQKDQFWFKNLSGVSVRANVKIADKKFDLDILFTHKGLSGPAILNTSLYWKKGVVLIDFLPNISVEKVLKKSKKLISTALPMPKRFVKEFLDSLCIADKSVELLSAEEREKIKVLKAYKFSPAGNFGYQRAEVTKGGICTDEVNADTLESKKQKGLFFLGEVLDVTGELGGYNFQWAFSSAYVCASHIASSQAD